MKTAGLVGGTEARNPASTDLSDMSPAEVVALMTAEEYRVLDALAAVTSELAMAASRVAAVYRTGGRVFLVGAGTSGRLAVMEAAELPPTFGAGPDRFIGLAASKTPIGPAAVAASEDDTQAVVEALSEWGVGPADGVIGLAASGTTPFVVEAVRAGRAASAWTCGIANNPETPLLETADLGVLLDTGPELVTGSTRLKAGTAQKLALNRITTAAFVELGHVRSNLMVMVSALNWRKVARSVHTDRSRAGWCSMRRWRSKLSRRPPTGPCPAPWKPSRDEPTQLPRPGFRCRAGSEPTNTTVAEDTKTLPAAST